MTPPRELILRSDELEVVILPELGARLHRVRAFGLDLLRTPGDPGLHREEPFFWGGYPMAPWCNRAPAGESRVAGRSVRLASNFEDGSAIHGLVATAAWADASDGSLRVDTGGPEHGWPWRFEVELMPAVSAATLTLDLRLVNRSDASMPAGLGLHPWFRRPLEIRVPAEVHYASNSRSPRDPQAVVGSFDLRDRGPPALGLDATWAALAVPRVDLAWPEIGLRATLDITSDDAAPCVAIASPASIDAIAVEPQTHGPDPLRRVVNGEPDAPRLLEPGETMHLGVRLSVERAADPSASDQGTA